MAGIRQFWQAVSRVKPQGRRAVSSLSSRGQLCDRQLHPQRGRRTQGPGRPVRASAHSGRSVQLRMMVPWRLLHKTDTGSSKPQPGQHPCFRRNPPPRRAVSCPLSRGCSVLCWVPWKWWLRGTGCCVSHKYFLFSEILSLFNLLLCRFFFFWEVFSIAFLFKYVLHILLCLSMCFPVFFMSVYFETQMDDACLGLGSLGSALGVGTGLQEDQR